MQATLCYFEYLGKSSIALNASFLCPLNIYFVEIPFLIDFNVRVKIFLRLLMLLPNLRRIMCPRRTWDIVLNLLLWFDRGSGKRRICSLQYLAAVWPLQLQGFGKSNRRKSFRLMARIHGHARLNICIYIRIVTLKLYKSGSVCLHQIFTFLPYENKYKLYIYIQAAKTCKNHLALSRETEYMHMYANFPREFVCSILGTNCCSTKRPDELYPQCQTDLVFLFFH